MLRVKIIQETAHFRIPTIGVINITYPLPPPSTVYGFLRHATDLPINAGNTKIAIQGSYEGSSIEIEKLIEEKGGKTTSNVIRTQILYGCEWIIHLKSEPEFENEILSRLENSGKITRFGRTQDLIIDFSVEEVEEKELSVYVLTEDGNDIQNKSNYYVNPEKMDLEYSSKYVSGSMYLVPFDTDFKDNKTRYKHIFKRLIYTDADIQVNDDYKDKTYDGKYVVCWI